MRTFIPLIALSLSALLLVGCPDDGTNGGGGEGGDGTGATDGDGTGATDGDGTGATGGDGGGATGGDGGGGSTGDVCGAGTACNTDDGDSGEWCRENVCGTPDDANLDYAFCNDFEDNPNADGEFACGCLVGECSRTVENNCFPPTDCDPTTPDGDSSCQSICTSECAPADWRDAFCAPTGPDTGFCECLCADGTGTCFD
jgi:hypothetical protein